MTYVPRSPVRMFTEGQIQVLLTHWLPGEWERIDAMLKHLRGMAIVECEVGTWPPVQ